MPVALANNSEQTLHALQFICRFADRDQARSSELLIGASGSDVTLLRAEFHPGEAHDAFRVNVPLLVMQQLSAHARNSPEEGVDRRRSAPLQVILIFADQLPEAPRIACLD